MTASISGAAFLGGVGVALTAAALWLRPRSRFANPS